MPFKLKLESNNVEIGHVDLIKIIKVEHFYMVFLKDIWINCSNQNFKIDNLTNLSIAKPHGYEYLASFDIIDSAKFNRNQNNCILLSSLDSITNSRYINNYSRLLSLWNLNDTNINWRDMSIEYKKIWLELCLEQSGIKYNNIKKNIVIDCTHISDIPSLYCLLGEAFFGWKGYIGSNLDALDDSLINIKSNGKKITFLNSNILIKNIDTTKNIKKYSESYISILTDIFSKHGFCVELH